jgi:hypothetical protein
VSVLKGPKLFPGDYAITQDGCSGVTLRPGASCQIRVVATLHGPGPRPGALEITDTAPGGPHLVGLSATGVVPSVQISPAVIPAGRVVTVQGHGFPARHPVTVTVRTPGGLRAQAKTDESGAFVMSLPVLAHAVVGTWPVHVTSPGTTDSADGSVLIVLGTLQPPDFLVRR